jgi:hypothetical protein
MEDSSKRCKTCGRTLPLTDFPLSGRNPKTGTIYHRAHCLKCHAMNVSIWVSKPKNRAHKLRYERERYEKMRSDPQWLTERRRQWVVASRRYHLKRMMSAMGLHKPKEKK